MIKTQTVRSWKDLGPLNSEGTELSSHSPLFLSAEKALHGSNNDTLSLINAKRPKSLGERVIESLFAITSVIFAVKTLKFFQVKNYVTKSFSLLCTGERLKATSSFLELEKITFIM